MADLKKLTGEDAHLYEITLGADLVGDGIDDLDDLVGGGVGSGTGFYRIVAQAAVSTLPAALDVDDWFYDSGSNIIPAIGDIVQFATMTEVCEIMSYGVSSTKSEIDVTTLCNAIKAFRSGKIDMAGTFEGIKITGGTSAQIATRNRILSQFIDVIEDDGTGVAATGWTKTAVNETLLWFFAYLDKPTATGDIEDILILPAILTSLDPAGVTIDAPETFNGGFRVDGGEKPQEYIRTLA